MNKKIVIILSIFMIVIINTPILGIFNFNNFVNASDYSLDNVIDYTTMIKLDNSNLISSLSASNYTISNDPRNILSYMYKDYGDSYFSGDWVFRTSTKAVSSTSASNYHCFWAVSNTIGSWYEINANNLSQNMVIRYNGAIWGLYLYNNGISQSYTISVSIWYYIEIIRVDSTLIAKIYNNKDFASIHKIATLMIEDVLTTSWRYLYGWDAFTYSTPYLLQSSKRGELSYNFIEDTPITAINMEIIKPNYNGFIFAISLIFVFIYVYNKR